jgi:hypothetical protein
MKKDLLKIAAEPITSKAYDVTVPLAELGFPEFGEDATITLRPPKYARGATKYLTEGRTALRSLERSMYPKPKKGEEVTLNPESFMEEGEERRLHAAHALECGYASLLVAGWESVEILLDPAKDVDVEAAAAGSYTRLVTKLVSSDAGTVLSGEPFEEPGYELEEGSACLPFTRRNIWKLFNLRPTMASTIYFFANDDNNFPEMPDPLASRTNGVDGARSTSKTGTPQKDASGHPKRAGRLRSSRTN